MNIIVTLIALLFAFNSAYAVQVPQKAPMRGAACPCKKTKNGINRKRGRLHNKIVQGKSKQNTGSRPEKACCDDCAKHMNQPKSQRPPCPC